MVVPFQLYMLGIRNELLICKKRKFSSSFVLISLLLHLYICSPSHKPNLQVITYSNTYTCKWIGLYACRKQREAILLNIESFFLERGICPMAKNEHSPLKNSYNKTNEML